MYVNWNIIINEQMTDLTDVKIYGLFGFGPLIGLTMPQGGQILEKVKVTAQKVDGTVTKLTQGIDY